MKKSSLRPTLLLIICACFFYSGKTQTTKTWKIQINSDTSAQSKQLFGGKTVKQGVNKFTISQNNYINLIVEKGKIVNYQIVSETGGFTIIGDLGVARRRNSNALMGPCDLQRQLCQIHCSLSPGGSRDPMHPGSCHEQCDNARKGCFDSMLGWTLK